MSRLTAIVALTVSFVSHPSHGAIAKQPASDPQALAYAAQSIAALTGGTVINDVTLTGNVVWLGTETGTATLKALGTGESRMDLALSSGTRSEIRDAQTGYPIGEWINPTAASGRLAGQNCQTDAVWFFPALGALAAGSNIVLKYVGQETRNEASVQHIQSYVFQPTPTATNVPQHLSTMDFYLDATTLLPVAITFNGHPDSDENTNFLIEVDFSVYETTNGALVPMHIQRLSQGNLNADITLTGASFNTGLSLSDFAIQ